MKNKDKIRIHKFVLKLVDPERIQIFLGLLILLVVLKVFLKDGIEDPLQIIDISLFTSIIFLYIVNKVTEFISVYLNKKLEDSFKLDINYNSLISRYPLCDKIVKYNNSRDTFIKEGRKSTSTPSINKEDKRDEYKFPIIIEKRINGQKIIIEDTDDLYILPKIVKANYERILKAHTHSNVYNQLNIRLDDLVVENDKIILKTSRTTYFDSLVTNRAMDFKWGDLLSNRELLNPGPILHSLKDSVLSNHLGFNAYVETSDGKIVFIIRGTNVSVGKNSLGSSIGASLKTMYALNKEGRFTIEGLINGVEKELHDELNLGKIDYEFSIEENLIAIYRDIVEGGKPQFLLFIKVNITSDELENKFNIHKKKIMKSKSNKLKEMLIDGNKLVYVRKEDLGKLYITPDTIVFEKKSYDTLPTVSGTLVILIDHLKRME